MPRNEPPNNGQSGTCAAPEFIASVQTLEHLEYLLKVLCLNADAVVGDVINRMARRLLRAARPSARTSFQMDQSEFLCTDMAQQPKRSVLERTLTPYKSIID